MSIELLLFHTLMAVLAAAGLGYAIEAYIEMKRPTRGGNRKQATRSTTQDR